MSSLYPQLQGLSQQEVLKAQEDPLTIWTKSGELLLVQGFISEWFSHAFFKSRFASAYPDRVYYAPNSYDIGRELFDEYDKALTRLAIDSVVVLDYYAQSDSSDEPGLITRLHDAGFAEAAIGIYGVQAHIYHYAARASCSEMLEVTSLAERVSGDELSAGELSSMYGVYRDQFTELASEHPIAGILPEEHFYQASSDPVMRHVIRRDEVGAVCAFGTYSDQLCEFPWLDARYFTATHEGYGDIFYAPTVVTRKGVRGATYLSSLFKAVIADMSASGDHVFCFECSDRSAAYIPKRIQRAYSQTQGVEAEVRQVGRQVYRAFVRIE